MNLKKTILLVAIILIIIFIFTFLLINLNSKFQTTGKTIENPDKGRINEYSYTKAICNESNFCQDYEISCNKNEIISIKPVTGAVIQHSEDWNDPRNNVADLCP